MYSTTSFHGEFPNLFQKWNRYLALAARRPKIELAHIVDYSLKTFQIDRQQQRCGAGGTEIILRIRIRSRNYLFINIDFRLEVAMMNKNSFLPPLKHISYVITEKVHVKVAI